MVVVGLAGIGGQELAPPVDFVADGGHMVLVAAAAQEGKPFPGGCVLGQQALHVAFEGILGGERIGQVQTLAEPQFLRHVLVEFLGALGADLAEHRRFDGRHRVGDIGIGACSVLCHSRLLEKIVRTMVQLQVAAAIVLQNRGQGKLPLQRGLLQRMGKSKISFLSPIRCSTAGGLQPMRNTTNRCASPRIRSFLHSL